MIGLQNAAGEELSVEAGPGFCFCCGTLRVPLFAADDNDDDEEDDDDVTFAVVRPAVVCGPLTTLALRFELALVALVDSSPAALFFSSVFSSIVAFAVAVATGRRLWLDETTLLRSRPPATLVTVMDGGAGETSG